MTALIIKTTTRLIACFLLLIPLTSWSAESDETAMLSLEEIVKLRQVSKARMNHNGDAVAYILSVPRELYKDDDGPAWKQLHVVNVDGESRAYFAGKVNVSDLAWSATGSELFFVGKRDVEADHPNIFQIALDGGEAQILFEGKSGIESIHPSPDGKTIAFLATDPAPEDEETLSEKGFKAKVYEESARPTHVWLLDARTQSHLPRRQGPYTIADHAWSKRHAGSSITVTGNVPARESPHGHPGAPGVLPR